MTKTTQGRFYSRPAQIFFRKIPKTPQGTLGQKVSAHQFLSNSGNDGPRGRGSEADHFSQNSLKTGTSGAAAAWSNVAEFDKIGVHLQRSPEEIEAFIGKKFGLA